MELLADFAFAIFTNSNHPCAKKNPSASLQKLVTTCSVRASNFDCFCLVSARTSEGVIAYYWSQFDIPIEDLEIVPEFSEERVLKVLEDGIQEQRSVVNAEQIKITEITASCRYHHSAVRLSVCVTTCGRGVECVCNIWLHVMKSDNQRQ